MPLGIPKGLFSFMDPDGETNSSWTEIQNFLYEKRILLIFEEIKPKVTCEITGLLLCLSNEDEYKDFTLFINSAGGKTRDALPIYDTMQVVAPAVRTVGIGVAASMGALILLGGEMGKRTASPNCRIKIHSPARAFYTTDSDSDSDSDTDKKKKEKDPKKKKEQNRSVEDFSDAVGEMLRLREELVKIYAKRTQKPISVIEKDLARDLFMSSEEAKEYGIIDTLHYKFDFKK
uniref:ATP-dependent Clp protease proteolytic subunit n=1 Tax=Silene conoidea TaxID=490730 RepID=V9PF58_9CARY|nr:clp protease proteolytic subunit [Silene conoidea]AGZ18030.1 clp protease proteolytic subunit [Silene conoidea]